MEVRVVPVPDLLSALGRLEDELLDNGHRLHAAGVRRAIELIQKSVQGVQAPAGQHQSGSVAGGTG